VPFAGRRQTFRQSPRIAVLLQAMHDIIGNTVTFLFRQFLAKSAHKFAGTSQRECNSETQQVPAGTHVLWEQMENDLASPRCQCDLGQILEVGFL
jgi:hypothetical protein